jgi:predicted molibdopterin-dependent oxidoreductase YjgC
MTRKVPGLNVLHKEELVKMNPVDASRLGIANGDRISVKSRRGEVKAKALLTEDSPEGVISMSFHFSETPTNRITNPALDPVCKTPEYKVCAVKVVKLAGA